MKIQHLIAFLLPLLGSHSVHADVTLSKIFGNHMVIQQELPIRIFGKAEPGEKITVKFGEKTGQGSTSEDGTFRVDLPGMKADGKARTLTVSGKNKVTLKDVLLGEVWICSGQSNMEWSVAASLNPKTEIAAANYPKIRLYNVPGHVASPTPLEDPRGKWEVCSPSTIPGFSAVGYYFGKSLHQELKVPIGLVGTNWGGTRIEPWTPPVGFRQVESLQDYSESLDILDPATPVGKKHLNDYMAKMETWMTQAKANLKAEKRISNPPVLSNTPKAGASTIYNGMVHGLIPLSVRGAIWYQGESNAGDGLRYEFLKEALVKGWRSVFENEELSFYWVQLANFQNPSVNPEGGGWGPVREGQRRALRLPKTGMAVIIDIGEARDIHPKNKQDVGARLALWALAKDYGKKVTYSGPLYKSMKIEGDKIRIFFDHAEAGLITAKKEGLAPAQETEEAVTQFAIQEKNGSWYWATAKIEGDTVVVSANGVSKPQNVRFGYQSNPNDINLYNFEGLPASPFTTEK